MKVVRGRSNCLACKSRLNRRENWQSFKYSLVQRHRELVCHYPHNVARVLNTVSVFLRRQGGGILCQCMPGEFSWLVFPARCLRKTLDQLRLNLLTGCRRASSRISKAMTVVQLPAAIMAASNPSVRQNLCNGKSPHYGSLRGARSSKYS